MKYNFKPVPRPERTVVSHVNGVDKVYLTLKVEYSKEKKRSSPKRVYIGKLNDDGMLLPNQNYVKYFGLDADDLCSDIRSDAFTIGHHFVFSKIAERLQLYDLLNSIFGKDASKIMDIASFMIVTEDNKMQYFDDYAYDHSLFSDKPFSDSTISNFLDQLKVKDIDTFINAWANMLCSDKIYVAYDSTNMNSEAGNIDLVEYGHAKDNDDLPQINVSLGYNQDDQIPLFYEIYPGSIIDNTECEKMVQRAKRYGCENIGFILDRGYFSINNIRWFEKNGYDYIVMAKGNAQFIKKTIEERGALVKNGYSCYLKEHELYGTTVEMDLFNTGHKQYVHLYYNGVNAENEKVAINRRFSLMDEKLEKMVRQKLNRKESLKPYEKYYRLKFDDNGYFQYYYRKDKAIKKLINKTGYFTIVTTEKMDAAEALERYRDRDAIEKIFRMEKSYLGNDVFRVHNTERTESKMFITFIALILRNEMQKAISPLYQKNKKEYTVPKVIRTLDKMYLTKMSDDQYYLRYNLTKKKKELLKALTNCTEKDYKEFAQTIIDSLT